MEIEELLRHAKRLVKTANHKCDLAHVAAMENGYFIYKTSKDLI